MARLRRLQRQVGFARRAIGVWVEQLEYAEAGFRSLESDLAEETGEEPVDAESYEGEYDTSEIEGSPEASDVPLEVPPVVETEGVEVDIRALNDVFRHLGDADFTDDFYPRVDAVNQGLAARGEPDVTRATMHPLFDRFLHDGIAEGEVAPPARWSDKGGGAPAGAPAPVTDAVLFEAFRTLGAADLTADKQYPLVAEVRARVPDRYERPSTEQIRAAWERWQKQNG